MSYDRDVKWMLRINLALLGVNAGGAILCALIHRYFDCGVFLVWIVNMASSRGRIKAEQHMRDRDRVLEAMLTIDVRD